MGPVSKSSTTKTQALEAMLPSRQRHKQHPAEPSHSGRMPLRDYEGDDDQDILNDKSQPNSSPGPFPALSSHLADTASKRTSEENTAIQQTMASFTEYYKEPPMPVLPGNTNRKRHSSQRYIDTSDSDYEEYDNNHEPKSSTASTQARLLRAATVGPGDIPSLPSRGAGTTPTQQKTSLPVTLKYVNPAPAPQHQATSNSASSSNRTSIPAVSSTPPRRGRAAASNNSNSNNTFSSTTNTTTTTTRAARPRPPVQTSQPGDKKGLAPDGTVLPEEIPGRLFRCREPGCTKTRKQRREMRRHYRDAHAGVDWDAYKAMPV